MNKKTEIIILFIMCFILTIAITVQINTVNNNGTTYSENLKESNLKSQVLKMKEKYENQYTELERAEQELEKVREQATSNNTELEELELKIKQANILLGNTNVSGSGIMITLTDGKGDIQTLDSESLLIHAENVLEVVNELKNSGAEAISINDERIVNPTAISCDGNVIVVNGKKITSPIKITAIGNQALLATLDRAGGTLEVFANYGKQVELNRVLNIQIPKYTGVYNFKYAKTVK